MGFNIYHFDKEAKLRKMIILRSYVRFGEVLIQVFV
jgi:hypothetical protein